MSRKEWVYSIKRICRVLIDLTLFAFSLLTSYKLRIQYHLPINTQDWFWTYQLPVVLPFVVGIRMAFLFIFQVYRKMWRYTEINEILELGKPIILSSLILAIPRILGMSAQNSLLVIPAGIIIIDSALSLIFLSIVRLLRKWQIDRRTLLQRERASNQKSKKRTLLIGAGQAAQELARKVNQHPELDIQIVCALDDDKKKHNIIIADKIKVIGQIENLNTVIKEYDIEQIIIAIPSLPPKELRRIIELCQTTRLETKIIPGVDQLAGGKVTIEKLRKVSLEDLLGREPVDLSLPEIASFINNKIILITGAGGSIGSELAKQLLTNCSPKQLFILGRGENSIFQLCQELKQITTVPFVPVICDIRNYKLLLNHLKRISPDIIFHAAAHKHVPLMEEHPQEAFENNVIGTKNIAEIAGLVNAQTFVNISTDKAVNPINVLGSTKRLAELVVNSFSTVYPGTKYISVRFGNVIGSRGSVIPIWEWQLKNSLPINVTDKDAYRFFMTTTEAVQLVIKASVTGKSSEIMVLDMGNDVNIYELAKDFIKLSGYDPEEVKITFSGLRPGEKLKEELVGYYEGTASTKHKKILVIEPGHITSKSIMNTVSQLEALITANENSFKEKLISEITKLNKQEKVEALI